MMIIENTIDNSPKVPRANFLGSDGLFCLLAYVSYKKWFLELWQQLKQLKTMEMSEAWPDTYNEGSIHQFQPEPTHKIH